MDKLPLPIKIVLLAGIYALSALVGLQFADTQSSVTLIWPPTGIALAGLLIFGLEVWPGIVFGTVIAALLTSSQAPVSWLLIVALAVSNTLEAVVSLFLLRRLHFQSNLSRIRDIFLLGLVATTVGALIGATFGVTSLFELSPVPIRSSYLESWLQWWLGDSMGVLVFTPLLLVWYHRPDGYVPPRRLPGRILLVLIPALVAALVFLIPPPMLNFPLGHAIFPFILWLALNLQLREVTLAGLLVSGVAVWGTAQGEGPFSRPDMHENMLYLWTFIMTTNVTAVVMAVIVREWRESSLTMRRERDFMMQITNALGQGVTVTDEDGRFVFANPAFLAMLGYDSPERVVGEMIRNMTISADIEILEHARELRFLGQTNTYEIRLMHTDGHLVHTRITGAPRWQDGRVTGTIAVFTDVTEQRRMEAALRESEQRFRSVFESCPVGIATADRTGLVISVNQAYVDLIGFANSKVENTGDFNLLSASTFEKAGIQEHFIRLYQEHTPFSVEAEVEGDLGRRIRRYQGVPMLDAAGNITGAVVITEDITERKQSEEKIRDREQRLRTIFDNAPVGILVGDANGILTDINDTYMNILGGSPEQRSQIIGRIGLHNIDTFKNAGIHEYFERLLEHGESFSTDAFIVSLFGRERNLHYQGTPLFDSEGRVSGLILVTEDITPRKEIENQLRRANAEISSSRDALHRLIQQIPIGIQVFNSDGKCTDVNPAHLTIFGISRGQIVDRYNIFEDKMAVEFGTAEGLRRALKGEVVDWGDVYFDFTYADPRFAVTTGQRAVHVTFFPVYDDAGSITSVVAMNQDITERKQAEEALRQSEERFYKSFHATPTAIAINRMGNGLFLDVNQGFLQTVGYTRDEVIGRTSRDLGIWPSDEIRRETMRRLAEEGQVKDVESFFRHKSGELRTAFYSMAVMTLHGEPHVLTQGYDITERKRAEEQLRHRNIELEALRAVALAVGSSLKLGEVLENLLTQLAELVPYVSASLALSQDGKMRFVAQRGIPENFDLRQIEDVLNRVEQQRLSHEPVIFADVYNEEHWVPFPGFQEYIRSWMGVPLIYRDEIIGTLNLDYDEPNFYTLQHANLAQAVARQAAIAIENARLYGDMERLVEERTRELQEANENLTQMVERLQELDKLRAKFVSDVSHELRTPLTVMSTRIYLLERGGPERQAEYLPGLKMQVERLTSFVETILDLSRLEQRRASIEFRPTDLNDVAQQVILVLKPRAEVAGLELTFEPSPHLPRVPADLNQMIQVVTNIVANAINYTPAGGVYVSTGYDADREQVWLQVRDTGMGIAEEDKPHLFDRFYRGDRAGSSTIPGTGLGLSIVKEIMDIHGGEITFDSQVHIGTTFTIWMPHPDV